MRSQIEPLGKETIVVIAQMFTIEIHLGKLSHTVQLKQPLL
jgi:hypothetical protein